ncbi:MAG: hypothetical protein JSW28_03915 [Thermoplasmata archaeon]|nr:MAG: hypothetical protein JSW28_03915 [Thermoplasmata archaeon]
MFPKHCSHVSIKVVSFPLTGDDIQDNLLGKSVYKKTEFLILKNGDDWAVVGIRKASTEDLFSEIEEMEIISLPENTKYVEDSSINVLSPTMMAEKADALGTKTLVVKGKFEHVSFIHEEERKTVVVHEVVPPEAPKLVELVTNALNYGNVPFAVKVAPQILDLRDIEKNCTKKNMVFPCHASGLESSKNVYYLDEGPELSREELAEVSLLGCDLSLRIFKNLYGIEPEFFNFCPERAAMNLESDTLAIAKCCKVKEGFERTGNLVVVPWGATQKEVEEALSSLLSS